MAGTSSVRQWKFHRYKNFRGYSRTLYAGEGIRTHSDRNCNDAISSINMVNR